MLRVLHLADLHPNNSATFAGKLVLDPATGQNQALTDLDRSLEFVFTTATHPDTRCDLAVIPGDLFDSPRPHSNEVRVISAFLAALADEMPVVIEPGNHDLSQNPLDASALECLRGLPIHIFTRPETRLLTINGQPVRVFGLPYPSKARLLANEEHKDKSPEEVTALINHGLAAILRAFTLQIEPGVPSILLAHGSVSNAKVGDQPRSLAHDILIPLEECLAFTYTALGHIHQGQQVSDNAWYSGSLMRNGFGEEHEPKGFNLVEMEKGQPAKVIFVENPHTRVCRTLTVRDCQDLTAPDPQTVYRIKDSLTAGDYESSKGVIEAFAASVPYCQTDIEITAVDRARDAGMAKCVTVDEALARALEGKVEAAELPGVLEKHHRLMQEVGA